MTCECYRVAGWSSSVARRAHNPKVVGSNPAPATRKIKGFRFSSEAFFRKRDLFPTTDPIPNPHRLSGLRASTRLRRGPRTLVAEGIRPAPRSRTFCRWYAPESRVAAGRYRPGRPDGLATNDSVDETALPAKEGTAGRSSRMACRSFSFAAVYSWSNRSSTRCRVMFSSEAAAKASDTLSLGTTIKTYSSPPVSHSRIVRP